MAIIDIKVPDIGDFKDVGVIELLVKPGDTVAVDQSLLTVESDKASMEIPSSHAGVVKEIKVKVGDKVNQGDVIISVDSAVSSAPSPAGAGEGRGEGGAAASAPAAAPATAPSPQPSPASGRGSEPAPVAANFAGTVDKI